MDFIVQEGTAEDEALALAAGLESDSEHAIAQAIVAAAQDRDVGPISVGVLAPWGIFMPPAVGALIMSLSTIIVAINAQTLRRISFS